MTKNWDVVREEACRMYIDGSSLTSIKAHLERTRKFRASERSFREKFREWGVTRRVQLEKWRAKHRSIGSARASLSPIDDRMEGSVQDSPTFQRAQSEPVESWNNGREASNGFVHNELSASKSHHCSFAPINTNHTCESVTRVESVYYKLQVAKDATLVRTILSKTIRDASGSILHYVAGHGESRILDWVIEYADFISFSIDMLDETGRTPLELAIRANRKENVELLLEAGASVRASHGHGQPLHVAISSAASSDIVLILLKRGADLETRQHQTEDCPHEPICLAWDGFLASVDRATKHTMSATIETLLDYGASIATNDDNDGINTLRFLRKWTKWDSANDRPRGCARFRLWHYLWADCNPLCWFPRQYCPSKVCDSFASYIFSHTPESGLTDMMIDGSDLVKYGQDLVYLFLSPCANSQFGQARPSDFLGRLMNKMDKLNIVLSSDNDQLCELIELYRGADEVEMASVLLQCNAVSWNDKTRILHLLSQSVPHIELPDRVLEHAKEQGNFALFEALLEYEAINLDRQRCILSSLLPRVEVSHRLRFAEIFLRPGKPGYGLTSQEFYQSIASDHLKAFGFNGNDPPEFERARCEFRVWLLQDLQIQCDDTHDANVIADSVIDVLTTLILRGSLHGRKRSGRDDIWLALRLRRKYELPSIEISSRSLFNILNAATQDAEVNGASE